MWRQRDKGDGATTAPSLTAASIGSRLMQSTSWDPCVYCGAPVQTSRPGGWTSNVGAPGGVTRYWHDACAPQPAANGASMTEENEQETGHYQVHLSNGQTWSSELDITLELKDSGALLALDPEQYEIAIFAPTGWTHVVWVPDTEIDEA